MQDMKKLQTIPWLIFALAFLLSCSNKRSTPSETLIEELDLKRGPIISCGVSDQQFGTVDFEMSCDTTVKEDFNLAMELLHSFEYDESEKAFAKVIDQSPDCAMAYWGVAMSNFHPLWTPPTEAELEKGTKAIEIAQSIPSKTKKEAGYIDAIALYFKDHDKSDHHTRCLRFEKAMEQLYASYPEDKEAAIFYALSLDAAADPTDKTYTNQQKAGAILDTLYKEEPDHPGVIHYIIHTYDYPGLAMLALPAAERYAMVAPSSAHALHMPSHIFIRLGLWDEAIQSNIASVAAAKCYAEQAGIKGHWDEELHGLDYLVYAYLQKRDNKLAEEQVKYVNSINEVYPVDFKDAYAFAAVPARFVLENKDWAAAAALQIHPNFPWNKFPWQEAIFHYTKLLGYVHTGKPGEAKAELAKLNSLHDSLELMKDAYNAKQVEVQIRSGEAWITLISGNKDEALHIMKRAADMEDSTEKHPVTPGEVIPARELLGDMFLEVGKQQEALDAYETVLKKCPGRFNSLQGVAASRRRM